MCILLAGSCTLCSNLATLVDCYVVPLGRYNVLLELSLVKMKGFPCSPVLDIDPVSLIEDKIVPFWKMILSAASSRL